MSKHRVFFVWAGLLCGIALFLLQAQTTQAGAGPVQYTASPTNGAAPLTVQFNSPSNDSSGVPIESWSWNFGDGIGTSTNQNPVYTYMNAGVFVPTLSVTNNESLASTGFGPSITVTPFTGVMTWTNSTGGNWNVPANWSPNLVPGVTNTALITASGTYTVTLSDNEAVNTLIVGGSSGTQTLNITGGTFTLNGSGAGNAQAELSVTGGTIAGTGPMVLAGPLNWTAGTISGVVQFSGGIFGGSTLLLQGGQLINNGTLAWTSQIYTGYGSVISNTPGGTINLAANNSAGTCSTCEGWPGPYSVDNAGQLIVSGSGSATIADTFNNSGTVDVQSGVLLLSGGGSDNGVFAMQAGGTLNFNGGTHAVNSGSSISGAGNLTISAGTVTLTGSAAVNGSILIVSGGTAVFNSSGVLAPAVIDVNAGTLAGTSLIAASGPLNWTGGTISGLMQFSGGSFGGSVLYLQGGQLINNGALAWTSLIYTGYGSVISNTPGGTINLAANNSAGTCSTCEGWPGPYSVDNAGQLIVSGSGSATIADTFNNSGTVDVQSGVLLLTGGGSDSGVFTMAAGGTLNFNGGTHAVNSGSSISGAGNLTISAGTVTLTGGAAVNGSTLIVSGGTAVFNSSGLLAPAVIDVSAGTLAGTSLIVASGPLNWASGTISGLVQFDGGSFGGSVLYLQGGQLINNGTLAWTSQIYTGYGSVISNMPGGTINLAANNSAGTCPTCEDWPGPYTVDNAGQLIVSGSGSATIADTFNNSGTVNVQSGVLLLSGGGSDNGVFAMQTGGTLNFNGGTHAVNSGSSISGAGNLTISAGTVTFTGGAAVSGSTLIVSGGMAVFNSSGVLAPAVIDVNAGTLAGTSLIAASGPLNWTGGTISGLMQFSGGGFGGSVLYLQGGQLINNGALAWTSQIYTGYGSVISNMPGGTINLAANNSASTCPTCEDWPGPYTVDNAGQLIVSGSGSATIADTFNNSGTVSINSGTLGVTGAHNLAGGTLNFGIGSLTNFGQISLSGAAGLTGTLSATLANGFIPSSGNSWHVLSYGSLSGSFTNTNLPPPYVWQTSNGATAVTIIIEAVSTVQFSANPTNGPAPLSVSFTSPASDSAGNAITNRSWNFGDGVGTSTNQNPSYTYTNAGSFTPSLMVINSNGTSIIASGPSITVSPAVSQAASIITWTNPAPIIYGTALGSNQLNATANVPGSFTYAPASGTLFNAGTHALSVTFTPSDTVDYASATTNVTVVVSPAPLTVTASNVIQLTNASLPVFGGTITGTNFADNITATYSCNATASSPAGTYPIVPALVANSRLTNYTVTLNIGTLTISAGVIVTSPANGQSFAAPASFSFGASANLPGGLETFSLFTNSVQVASGSSANISTVLSGVPSGSYRLAAVATNNGNQTFSETVYVTVDAPGTTLIDFDPLDTSRGVMNNAPLFSYLSGFGVTISNVTFGTSLEAATGLEATSQSGIAGGELPAPSSPPNLFTQVGSSQPVTFTLNFATNLQSFGFTRVGLDTNTSSAISHPAWTASILDGLGNVLESVSEPLLLANTNIAARTFNLIGSNIAAVRFDSDSQGIAAFAAVLLDDLLLNTNATNNPLSISLAQPAGATAPASITLSATATDSQNSIDHVAFYSGPTLIGSVSNSPYAFLWTNVLNGTYILTAQVVDTAGYAKTSAPVTNTVQPGGSSRVVNFDDPEAVTELSAYLAANDLGVATNSLGTMVVAENQNAVAGGNFAIASSQPNLLTQSGSSGPVSFTVDFSNSLAQFSFTRPELLASPFVTHPAWQVQAFDALGLPLDATNAAQISSATNVPAQSYTLANPFGGAGIASIEFNSEGTGLTTFNAMLLDDFVLGAGSNLPPSVLIASPTNGQVFTSLGGIPISAEAVPGSGTVAGVTFYYGGTGMVGDSTNSSSPFSILWNAPSNGTYALTAVASNSSGLNHTSAPVLITIAPNGFAIVTPPVSQTVGASNNATFSVTTSFTNGASYQWQFNGGAISGATLSSYSVNNAQTSSAGSYTVVASGAGQSITSQPPAVLTVLGPPSVSASSPTNVVVNIGSNVTLSVSASDASSVSFYYRWRRNGQFLAGATNGFYTINNAQPSDSGNYQVLVANAVASQPGPVFGVTVNFLGTNAPSTTNDLFTNSLSINPTNGPVGGNNSGSPASGELATIAGKPAGRFLWYHWTANFTGVISLSTLGSGFDTLLGVYTGSTPASFTKVAEDDDSAGFFDSLVSFNCVQGTTYQIAVAGYKGASGNVVLYCPAFLILDANYLNVAEPVITQQPSNQIVQAGATVTLSVTASNATTCQWYFSGVPVTGASATNLVISNFPTNAVGNYYVKAANGIGSVQSETAAIEIQNAGQTTGAPTNLLVDKFGDAVDLTGAGATERYRPQDAGGETGGFTLSQSFSTVGATKEEGEPNHAGQPGGASYWYSYTASGNGTLQFDTAGSTFDTILAVYTGPGDSFATLLNVGADYTTNYLQHQPVVLVTNATAGTKYYIAIDGYLGASGSAHLGILLNLISNATVSRSTVPVTNDNATIAITYPENNYLTTNSSLMVRGTVKGKAGVQQPLLSYVQLAVNGTEFGQATFGETKFASVLTPGPGGSEAEVAQESVVWSSNVTLVSGANFITAQSISVQGASAETASLPVTRTVFLVATLPTSQVRSTLTLVPSPYAHGKITGQADQASLEINKVYTVKAEAVGNWIFTNWTSGTNSSTVMGNSPSLSFIMTPNLILQANFATNPFTAFAGIYNGLFSPVTGVTEESSGFFTATLPGSSRGAYSARVMLDGGSYPFSGIFDLSGDTETTVARSGKPPLTIDMHLDLAAPDDPMTGSVITSGANDWASGILANRAVFNAENNPATNFAGRYTFVIPPGNTAPTNEPGGYGFATLTNNLAGHAVISGRLADSAAISQSVSISQNGSIPLYASLYSGQGSLLGWLTVTSNSPQTILGTNLTWIKLSSRSGTLYSTGFTNTNIAVLGSFYAAPASGASNLTLTLGNGGLNTPLVYSNLSVADNKLVNNDPGNPDSMEGVIAPGTGVLTVTIRPVGARSDIVAKGVMLQDNSSTNAAGWFLGTDQSGFFLLQQ